MRTNHLVKVALCGFVYALVACNDSSAPNSRPITLSFSTRSSAATAAQAPLDVTVSSGTNTIVITKAQIVIRKMELKQSTATTCPDDDSAHDDCNEVKLGPMLATLPLDGSAPTAITASVPEGTYHEVEFQIHRPVNSTTDAAFVAANPAFAGISIRLEGTYNGSPFVFTSTMSQSLEVQFDSPIVIDANNKNVTVNLDLSSWFKVNGVLIDPATANPGQTNEQAVTQNIRASLHAFDDDDHDGRDD